ncbi:hypothetical protein, partial [Alistipes dispar]|uniref:hypothetical protein n=1 Tax=Alistipes dispar TaxID=2585119 RepID=UPI003A90CE31
DMSGGGKGSGVGSFGKRPGGPVPEARSVRAAVFPESVPPWKSGKKFARESKSYRLNFTDEQYLFSSS